MIQNRCKTIITDIVAKPVVHVAVADVAKVTIVVADVAMVVVVVVVVVAVVVDEHSRGSVWFCSR